MWTLLLTAAVLGLAGCVEKEQIETYEVPKAPPLASATEAPPVGGGVAWFFKMLGPADRVNAEAAAFEEFLKSVRFNGETPEWTLPAGWTEEPGSALRFKTLVTDDADPRLEVSVSQLPAPDPKAEEYVIVNLNRWLGQIGLPNLDGPQGLAKARESGQVRELAVDGETATLLDALGEADGQPQRMLVALVPRPGDGGSAGQMAAPPSGGAGASGGSGPLTYTVPEGWTEKPAGGFRMASFGAEVNGEEVDVSVSMAGGDFAGNINRWRGQVGLEPLGESEAASAATSIEVSGRHAQMVELVGPEQTILGVVAPQEGQSLFIKLTAPNAAAAAEKVHFEEFARSLRLTR